MMKVNGWWYKVGNVRFKSYKLSFLLRKKLKVLLFERNGVEGWKVYVVGVFLINWIGNMGIFNGVYENFFYLFVLFIIRS